MMDSVEVSCQSTTTSEFIEIGAVQPVTIMALTIVTSIHTARFSRPKIPIDRSVFLSVSTISGKLDIDGIEDLS